MTSTTRGGSMSSLQATQSSSMESLESSMSTTESTIGAVCVCVCVCISIKIEHLSHHSSGEGRTRWIFV